MHIPADVHVNKVLNLNIPKMHQRNVYPDARRLGSLHFRFHVGYILMQGLDILCCPCNFLNKSGVRHLLTRSDGELQAV